MMKERLKLKRMFDILGAMYQGFDQMHASRTAATEQKLNLKVSCKRGCPGAACCHLLTTSTIPEAIGAVLYSCAHGHPIWKMEQAITEKFKEVQMPGLNIDIWARARHRCAFLKEDDTCATYMMRPWACRGLQAYTPPELCGPGMDSITSKDTNTLEFWHVAMAELARNLGVPTHGFAPLPYIMPVAIAYIERGADAANALIHELGLDDEQRSMARWLLIEDTGDVGPEMERALKWAKECLENTNG